MVHMYAASGRGAFTNVHTRIMSMISFISLCRFRSPRTASSIVPYLRPRQPSFEQLETVQSFLGKVLRWHARGMFKMAHVSHIRRARVTK